MCGLADQLDGNSCQVSHLAAKLDRPQLLAKVFQPLSQLAEKNAVCVDKSSSTVFEVDDASFANSFMDEPAS